MLKLKGHYSWKLINKDTGAITNSGEQDNLVTDGMIWSICRVGALSDTNTNRWKVFISPLTPPLPPGDYRQYAAAKSVFSSTWILEPSYGVMTKVSGLSKWKKSYNYPPAFRTINYIGLYCYSGSSGYPNPDTVVSFIELSTPITQSALEYLYVEYIIAAEYVPEGAQTPNNIYTSYVMNRYFNELCSSLGAGSDYPNTVVLRSGTTDLLPPVDVNNVGFLPTVISTLNSATNPSCYAQNIYQYFTTGQIAGYPLGASVRWAYYAWTDGFDYRLCPAIGYSADVDTIQPSISRVFAHPPSRATMLFNDPGYPPESRGKIIVQGSPSNKHTMIARIKITKTGDASDIVDGHTFTTNIGSLPDQLIVDQQWGDNDIIRFTGASLPAPLLASTDYYVLYVDSTHIKVRSAFGGSAITLTGDGAGTIDRQNTGRYSVEMEPYSRSSNGAYDIDHIRLPYDSDGNIFWSLTSKNNTYNLSGTAPIPYGYYRKNDSLYTIQESLNGDHIAKWQFNTVESSTPLHRFSTTKIFRASCQRVGTNEIYMATSNGVWFYDLDTDTVAPVN